MKVIICGPRDLESWSNFYFNQLVSAISFSQFKIDEIVEGGAPGVDDMAARYAKDSQIDHTRFDANWDNRGNYAGPHRNERMAIYVSRCCSEGGGLIALCKPEGSKGTNSMIKIAEKYNLKIYKHKLEMKG